MAVLVGAALPAHALTAAAGLPFPAAAIAARREVAAEGASHAFAVATDAARTGGAVDALAEATDVLRQNAFDVGAARILTAAIRGSATLPTSKTFVAADDPTRAAAQAVPANPRPWGGRLTDVATASAMGGIRPRVDAPPVAPGLASLAILRGRAAIGPDLMLPSGVWTSVPRAAATIAVLGASRPGLETGQERSEQTGQHGRCQTATRARDAKRAGKSIEPQGIHGAHPCL